MHGIFPKGVSDWWILLLLAPLHSLSMPALYYIIGRSLLAALDSAPSLAFLLSSRVPELPCLELFAVCVQAQKLGRDGVVACVHLFELRLR